MASTNPLAARAARPASILYLAGFALWIVPLLDLANILFPPHLSSTAWRISVASMITQALTTQIVAIALLIVAAMYRENETLERLLALACAFGVVVLIAVAVMFFLDILEASESVDASNKLKFTFATAKTALELLVGMVVLGGMSLTCFRHLAKAKDTAPTPQDTRSSMVLGQSKS